MIPSGNTAGYSSPSSGTAWPQQEVKQTADMTVKSMGRKRTSFAVLQQQEQKWAVDFDVQSHGRGSVSNFIALEH